MLGDEVDRITASQTADEAVWADLLRGEPGALGELFDRYSRPVYNFAFRRTASWVLAEEVTQATFVTAWRRSRGVAGRVATGRGWLFGIAENECRNAVRGSIRSTRLRSRLLDLAETDSVTDPADLVADRIDAERRMAAVRQALRRLPAHEQRTIELVVWSGLSTAEAATALGVAEGTVKSRLSRARGRLTRLIDAPLLGGLHDRSAHAAARERPAPVARRGHPPGRDAVHRRGLSTPHRSPRLALGTSRGSAHRRRCRGRPATGPSPVRARVTQPSTNGERDAPPLGRRGRHRRRTAQPLRRRRHRQQTARRPFQVRRERHTHLRRTTGPLGDGTYVVWTDTNGATWYDVAVPGVMGESGPVSGPAVRHPKTPDADHPVIGTVDDLDSNFTWYEDADRPDANARNLYSANFYLVSDEVDRVEVRMTVEGKPGPWYTAPARNGYAYVPAVTPGQHSTSEHIDKVTHIEDRAFDRDGNPVPIIER